jgi:8-oxo-dGTP pyrophosphatase MutT (NUDIX family)
MREVKSCGVIVMRRTPAVEFLLMKHPTRWDLPKGHVDPGESDVECALRELKEETGIDADDSELDSQFRFVLQYQIREQRFSDEVVNKTLLVLLGWLRRDVPIQVSEHTGYQWFRWNPPHRIQPLTIDPLLAALEEHLATQN